MPHIRPATRTEHEAIRAVHMSAFPDGENRTVATLAVRLLDKEKCPETLALVADTGDGVVGHIAFSPVSIENNPDWKGAILAPLGVNPDHQKHGIGSELIRDGMQRLSEAGVNSLFVYGDPAYYGRFGFSTEAAAGFLPEYELTYPSGWQAIALNEGASVDLPATISCVEPLNQPELW